MTRTRHVPQRSCVACRQVRPKTELLRIVRTPHGEIQVDRTGKVAGRGAYLCRHERCAEQALKQNKLGRALGVAVGEEVATEIKEQLARVDTREPARRSGDR